MKIIDVVLSKGPLAFISMTKHQTRRRHDGFIPETPSHGIYQDKAKENPYQ